jgi:MarR family transcriptional regulator for hemolysin
MELPSIPTYHACVLHARAYRTVREFMVSKLEPYGLTMMEWALLGVVDETKSAGISPSELSHTIDVGLPMITGMVNRVEAMQLIDRKSTDKDKRRRVVIVTPKGRQIVKKVESQMRADFGIWLSDVDPKELEAYVIVMRQLAHKVV